MTILQKRLQFYLDSNPRRETIKALQMNWNTIKEILKTGECSAIRKTKKAAEYLRLSCYGLCAYRRGGEKLVQVTIRILLGKEISKRDIATGMEIDPQTLREILKTGTCAFINKVNLISKVLELTPDEVCGVGE
jgi:hypothetical protein